ncbi:sulfate ABC transporter substrate-binding protein [Leptospira langatensis]|uniref:Sulfate ABC transporter substrate-binding protein n=1 Tax=Leptospira langatensis TaxID=2484983 RepID=A0A5F1ZW50_9LEPT|nr:sulfate ABC transporter substrate-binding protein [Leptospira langatensis]TGJ98168.1 sulfate ABC transporter substrate-binding protein [Leptospira langatensis]TGL43082.1 sulfate ABC transporter substrate-binding protein [Leptospira langatensis]
MKTKSKFLRSLAIFLLSSVAAFSVYADDVLLNVSFDPTRELYEDVNKHFIDSWKKKTGKGLTIQQSHGGSGKQARAVIDGLEADVVTLALAYDIDSIVNNSGAISKEWEKEFPHHSVPYYSTIVFLVRKGNPKAIKDWDDIVKPGIGVITPNPKTSGGARWNYLAAWGFAKKKYGTEAKATEFVKALYKNTSVLDTGARGSTTTFVQRGIGDVLLAWENEAELAISESKKANGGNSQLEVVYPSASILAETPVAVVEKVTAKKGTTELAKAYLNFLYTKEGQEIVAKHFFRPNDAAVLKANASKFPKINLFDVRSIEGSWAAAHKKHFADGGLFDSIYGEAKK